MVNASQEPLDEILTITLRSEESNRSFATHLFDFLGHQIHFDKGTVNLCVAEPIYQLSELHCYLYKEPESIGPNYQKTCQLDDFGPIILKYPYTALHGMDYIDIDQLAENPFYLKHCRHYEIENALAVSARIPGHLNKYLVYYLFHSTPGHAFSVDEIYQLNQCFPVLFNLWLYRLGFICKETLSGRLALLNRFGKRSGQLQLLKLIVQNPLGSNKDYARKLGISERTVEHKLNHIYEEFAISGLGNNKKAELFRLFHFLQP